MCVRRESEAQVAVQVISQKGFNFEIFVHLDSEGLITRLHLKAKDGNISPPTCQTRGGGRLCLDHKSPESPGNEKAPMT